MVNTIFNWAIAAIVASFTIMPVSINRQTAPTVEPVTEAELKGCATNFENDDRIPFYYDGPNYTKTEVEKLTNWKHGSNPQADCNTVNAFACGLLISPQYVDDSTSEIKLDLSFSLIADEISPTQAFVDSIVDEDGEIFNKSM